MKTINRIKKLIDRELEKVNHKNNTAYDVGKETLCRAIGRIIEDHKPEPPTVHPMSELPEEGVRFNILVIHTIYEAKVWDVGSLVRKNEISDGFRLFKLKDAFFTSESNMYKIIGWLPLPNPNEIL